MANGHFSGERKEISFAEDLGHKPHFRMDLDSLAGRGGNACAFLPAMLEREEPKECEAASGFLGRVYGYYPALLTGAVERAIVLV
jgi:hypothetical protein